LCRVLVFHFFLHHVMLNFTNICTLNTLQLRIYITIITGLAVSILNFLNQAICLIEKEMNSCCNLYECGTLWYLSYFIFSFLKVDKLCVNSK
jgi:hypothetical protein